MSALLRALADKIIPGSSLATKIALLQQTSTDKNPSREGKGSLPSLSETSELSALQYIVSNDSTRNKIQAELDSGYFALVATVVTMVMQF